MAKELPQRPITERGVDCECRLNHVLEEKGARQAFHLAAYVPCSDAFGEGPVGAEEIHGDDLRLKLGCPLGVRKGKVDLGQPVCGRDGPGDFVNRIILGRPANALEGEIRLLFGRAFGPADDFFNAVDPEMVPLRAAGKDPGPFRCGGRGLWVRPPWQRC